jgi:hypothetical protein
LSGCANLPRPGPEKKAGFPGETALFQARRNKWCVKRLGAVAPNAFPSQSVFVFVGQKSLTFVQKNGVKPPSVTAVKVTTKSMGAA